MRKWDMCLPFLRAQRPSVPFNGAGYHASGTQLQMNPAISSRKNERAPIDGIDARHLDIWT